MPPAELRAVTFDFWNTLIRADDAGIRPAAGGGSEPDGGVVRAARRHAGSRLEPHGRRNEH